MAQGVGGVGVHAAAAGADNDEFKRFAHGRRLSG
jgi:hypothetical protein